MKESEVMANAKEKFAEVYDAYFVEVYKFVYRRIQNEEIAEDIVQDVFCAAWKKRNEFLAHEEPKGWLVLTAKNKLRELYRRMKYRITEPLEEVPEPATVEADYGEIEMELTALTIIDEDEWKLIKDYYLVGITIKELAEKYGITENNMRVRLCRLRARLRSGINR